MISNLLISHSAAAWESVASITNSSNNSFNGLLTIVLVPAGFPLRSSLATLTASTFIYSEFFKVIDSNPHTTRLVVNSSLF